MKFLEKWPSPNENEKYDGCYIYSKKADNCYMCGRLTNFIDFDTKAYFCSEECVDKFYREIFKSNGVS